ncbi:uncharacterized protein [Euwallacea fornicatus]|uniref:uncharacterized protein n=1 Tax=Euwallacea fornicatus TaxID=995702 RepID=UPI0033906CE4
MANRDKIEKLDDLIKESIGGEVLEQHAQSLLPPGENYGSVMYKVDFKVRKGRRTEEHHAVAKCTPTNQITQELFNIKETFKAEIAWYTTVIPTLRKFAKDRGLDRDMDFFQEFYGARISLDPRSDTVDLDGVILTENLKQRGFYNIDRHVGFDASTTFSILKDLATFHAVPLAMRLKYPALFDTKVAPYCPKFGGAEGPSKEQIDKGLLSFFASVPEIQPYMDQITRTIKESFPFKQRELREPWISVIHLDFWCNNIMVTGGKNSKNIILDMQVPMIASPAADVIFFLLTSVSFEAIKTRFDLFLKFYYEEFIKNLKQLKVETSAFTFDSFIEEVNHAAKTAELAHSLGHVQMILMEKGTSGMDSSKTDSKPEDVANIISKPNPRQIEKTKWLIQEAVKRNWF